MRRAWVAPLVVVACSLAVGQAASPEATALMGRVWDYYGGLPSFFAQARVETRFSVGMGGMPGGEGLWVSETTQRRTLWYSPPYVRREEQLLSSFATVGEVVVFPVTIFDLARGRVLGQRPDGTWEWAPLDLLTLFQELVFPQVLFGFSPTYVYLSLEEGELDGRRVWIVHAEDELEIEMFGIRMVGRTSATFWVDPRTLRLLRVSDSTVMTAMAAGPLPPWLEGPEPGEPITQTTALSTITTWEEFIPGLVVPSELFAIPEVPMRGIDGAVEPYPAPEFCARDVYGREVSLSDFQGKVLLLYFGEEPMWVGDLWTLQEAAEWAGSERVAVVGVFGPEATQDPRLLAELATTAAARGIRVPLIPDPQGEIASRYGVEASPVTIVVDQEGLVRARSPEPNVLNWLMLLLGPRR